MMNITLHYPTAPEYRAHCLGYADSDVDLALTTLDIQTNALLKWDISSIADTTISYLNRMQKLRFMATSLKDIYALLSLSPGQASLLESVHEGWTGNHICSVFDGAPLLRELTLEKIFEDPYSTFILPWSQLTKLTICGCVILQTNLLKVLKACKQLVSASVDKVKADTNFSRDEELDFLKNGLYPLQNLLDLKIVLVNQYEGRNIFDRIACPALMHFWFSGDHDTVDSKMAIWVNFLLTAEELQSLTFTYIVASTHSLLSIFRCTPHLVKLMLYIKLDGNNYNDLIDSLTYYPGQSDPYLPQLQYLDIKIRYSAYHSVIPFHMSGYTFVAMVQSRQNCGLSQPSVVYPSKVRIRLGVPDVAPLEVSVIQTACETGEISGVYIHHDENLPFYDV